MSSCVYMCNVQSYLNIPVEPSGNRKQVDKREILVIQYQLWWFDILLSSKKWESYSLLLWLSYYDFSFLYFQILLFCTYFLSFLLWVSHIQFSQETKIWLGQLVSMENGAFISLCWPHKWLSLPGMLIPCLIYWLHNIK